MNKEIDCLVLNVPGKCEANCSFCYLKRRFGADWDKNISMEDELSYTANIIRMYVKEHGTLLLSIPHNRQAIDLLDHQLQILDKQVADKLIKLGVIALYNTAAEYGNTLATLIKNCVNFGDLFLSVQSSEMIRLPKITLGKISPTVTITINLILDELVTLDMITEMQKTLESSGIQLSEINVTIPIAKGITNPDTLEASMGLLGSSLDTLWRVKNLHTYASPCIKRVLAPKARERNIPCYAKLCKYAEITRTKVHRECPYDIELECSQ